MSDNKKIEKRYWTRLEQRYEDPATPNKEFAEDPFTQNMDTSSNRRDFLKILGFGVGTAVTLAACETPVKYALPYTNKPAEIMPGVANYYASTFFDGLEYNSVLIRTREGRPIKVEGNSSSPITPMGTSARAQASVLAQYDNNRLAAPRLPGKAAGKWADVDAGLGAKLNEMGANGAIRILTPTVISPSTKQLVADFAAKYPNTKHVTYDAISSSAILEAHEKTFGKRAVPSYRFDKADIIVSFNADFLGTWLSPTEFTAQWVQNRRFDDSPAGISRHIQFETMLTLTGANADTRIPIRAGQEGAHVLKLHNEIARGLGLPTFGSGEDTAGNYIAVAAQELVAKKGKALVVSGSNDVSVQVLVNAINNMLGSYGATIDLQNHCNLRQGSDAEFDALLTELQAGQVAALFVVGCNPAYSYPDAKRVSDAVKAAGVSVAFVTSENETSKLCQYALPTSWYLEAWGDAEPYAGYYSLQQPTIQPIFKTRQFQDNLLKWMGDNRTYHLYLKDYWRNNLLKMGEGAAFEQKWVKILEEGVYNPKMTAAEMAVEPVMAAVPVVDMTPTETDTTGATPAAPAIMAPKPALPMRPVGAATEFNGEAVSAAANAAGAMNAKGTEVVLYQKVAIGCGAMAHVPWLQELPDPITKATWDNYVCVPVKMAKEMGIETGDLVKLSASKYSVELPALVQPGLQATTLAVAVGYGRTEAGPAAKDIGKNAYPFATMQGAAVQLFAGGAKLEKASGRSKIAIAQTHGTIMGRDIVRETTVAQFDKAVTDFQKERDHMLDHLKSLYPMRKEIGHHWAMNIDLNACTGCGACVVACQAENNIPVVGKEEVITGREMHWIRIDRYYSDSTPGEVDANEEPAMNPEVVFQPMMCQHCDDAPCENVCPVLATVHSSEGLNQQAYNRCFGTRYCANNCPYKVRRFNWLDYTNKKNFKYNPGVEESDLSNMVLNPDVAIRARGVMEKCSFCVQRIQSAKLDAKKAGTALPDGAIKTACAQACPAGAITFGDINDKDSRVAALHPKNSPFTFADGRTFNPRSFHVIEEVKTRPSVSYLMKVRNKKAEEAKKLNV